MGVRHSTTPVQVAVIVAGLFCIVHLTAQAGDELDRGMTDFRAGNYSSAAARFARAESASPGSTNALLFEAKCFVHLGNFAAAEKALDSYLASHADSADAMYLLGFTLHRQNRPAESLATYTQAAGLVRPKSDDLKIVGLDYVLLDDYPDAIKWLEKSVEFDANNADAWYYLGRAYYTKARFSEARKAFHKLLDLDPRDSRAENNLGLIFETEGQPAEAIEAYRQAITWQQQSLRPSEQPYVNLGSLLLEQSQTKDAFEPLQRAVALAPGNAYCHVKLGEYYRKTAQFESAQRELEKATALEPDNATTHYLLGRLYKETHAMDRAQTEFDLAAELQTRAARSRPSSPNN
ncbi:MAG TPA: tetratricopeptide repeat protein [Candidatus Sulfotelmatobacter sp.]|jgi:tetratricopeptide (TPR) repeat protein